jgi:hypothetical protein
VQLLSDFKQDCGSFSREVLYNGVIEFGISMKLMKLIKMCLKDSSVGIVTRYVLDGPGIESRWGRDFQHRPWGLPSVLYNGYRVSFPGIKRPGRGVDHPPPSSA